MYAHAACREKLLMGSREEEKKRRSWAGEEMRTGGETV